MSPELFTPRSLRIEERRRLLELLWDQIVVLRHHVDETPQRLAALHLQHSEPLRNRAIGAAALVVPPEA